jgi:hypothetical protein
MPNYVLDSSATNANAAINKVVAITSTPTAGNANTVTSEGVKTYVDNADAAINARITKTVNGSTSNAVLFTKSFEGTAAFDGTNIVSIAHGLGATPFSFAVYYKAKTVNNGYQIGDIAKPTSETAYSWADGTYIYFRSSDANYYVTHGAGSSAFELITGTDWELSFKAFL